MVVVVVEGGWEGAGEVRAIGNCFLCFIIVISSVSMDDLIESRLDG